MSGFIPRCVTTVIDSIGDVAAHVTGVLVSCGKSPCGGVACVHYGSIVEHVDAAGITDVVDRICTAVPMQPDTHIRPIRGDDLDMGDVN